MMATVQSPIPEGYHTVTPQFVLDDAAKAIDWHRRRHEGCADPEVGNLVLTRDGRCP
jgi:hypothetical protein